MADLGSKPWRALTLGAILSVGALVTVVVGGTAVVIVTVIGVLLIVVGLALLLRQLDAG